MRARASNFFSPTRTLTVGFARRFSTQCEVSYSAMT